jgi:hypothetical protein
MREPLMVHIALDVERCALPEPRTGLGIAETGELMLCAGTELHVLHLDKEGWTWLANIATGMAATQALDSVVLPRLMRQAVGNA